MNDIQHNRVVNMRELCALLGCQRLKARKLIFAGTFPGAYKFNQRGDWKIPLADVEAFVARLREETAPTKFAPFSDGESPAATEVAPRL